MIYKISSRQSALAQIQAYQVGEKLKEATPELEVQYLFRESLGDKNLTEPLWKIPEKGVFTEDFYQDLVQGKTDCVVHSWKDLPTETKAETEIVATLERADQRDLLLFKKTSFQKEALKIYSSSPRRAFNLGDFLPQALPWIPKEIEFTSVRGNIQTRVQKLLDDSNVDGLILAKAAMDRLLDDRRFPEVARFLRSALEKCEWMVLPLSENPNAAAQGALAVEISKTNQKAQGLLEKINCPASFAAADRERQILQQYGGGCHLALGIAVLERDYGRIEMVRGLTPGGEKIQTRKLISRKTLPSDLKISRLEFSSERVKNSDLPKTSFEALFVSRTEAYPETQISTMVTWAAGVQTWKKLAKRGVWVHGCAEGLGESEDPRIDPLCGKKLRWSKATHEEAGGQQFEHQLLTYRLNLKLLSTILDPSVGAWRWKSASEVRLAFAKFPELKKARHLSGPGRTYQVLKEILGSDEKIHVELQDEFISAV